MKKIFLGLFISAFLLACNNEKKEDKAASTEPAASAETKKMTGDELLPASDGDWVKTALTALSKGDVDGLTANYDDNIRFTWSSGDSLIGKKAVQDYYKGRWQLIDSLNYSDHIILPIKVNVQQSPAAPPGRWTLVWSSTHVKYKNGKKLNFWVHSVFHHNNAGKVDFAGQYIDRHPIMEATKDMMKK